MKSSPNQINFNQKIYVPAQYSKSTFQQLLKAKKSSKTNNSISLSYNTQKLKFNNVQFQLRNSFPYTQTNKVSSMYESHNYNIAKTTDLSEQKTQYPRTTINKTQSNHQDCKNLSILSNENFQININHQKSQSNFRIQIIKKNDALKKFNQDYQQYQQDKLDIEKGVLTTHNFRKYLIPKKEIPNKNKDNGKIIKQTDVDLSFQNSNSKLKMANFLFNVKHDVNEKRQTVINLMKKMSVVAEDSERGGDKLKRDLNFVKNIFSMFLKKKKMADLETIEQETQTNREEN